MPYTEFKNYLVLSGVVMPSLELSEKLMRQLTVLAEGLDLSAEETLQSLIDSTISLQSDNQSDFDHIASLYQATADLFQAI